MSKSSEQTHDFSSFLNVAKNGNKKSNKNMIHVVDKNKNEYTVKENLTTKAATELLRLVLKKGNIIEPVNKKVEMEDSEKNKILNQTLDDLTQKYLVKIMYKITNSIKGGFTFSHVPFHRSDFKGWDKFVIGGYDNASPQQCATIFINYLISQKNIPERIKWDVSSFVELTPKKGTHMVKFSWDSIDIFTSDLELSSEKPTDDKITDLKDIENTHVMDLIPKDIEEKLNFKWIFDEYFEHLSVPLHELKLENIKIRSKEIVINLNFEDDKDEDKLNEFAENCIEWFNNKGEVTENNNNN